MLADVWPELEIIASCDNGQDALDVIRHHTPEIAFLDIRMPELDGMSLARRLVNMVKAPLVVFITAYDTYAVEAFEANAVDYLLKPLNEQRLETCIRKIQQRIDVGKNNIQSDQITAILAQLTQGTPSESSRYLKWIRVQKGDEIFLIVSSDVLFFKAEDKYVSLYQHGEHGLEEFLLRTSLKALLDQLDPEQFWQIHRSTAVNLHAIDKIKRDLTGKMYVLIADRKLPVSRAMQGKFLHQF
jgi:DNA-binding LytR/AlgR family response regulator